VNLSLGQEGPIVKVWIKNYELIQFTLERNYQMLFQPVVQMFIFEVYVTHHSQAYKNDISWMNDITRIILKKAD